MAVIENSVTTVTVQHREACRGCRTAILRDGTFNLHQAAIMDSFSRVLFRLEYVFRLSILCRAEISTFFIDVNLCV